MPPAPKPKMSGSKTVISYALAVTFDFLKFIFDMFVFFGPVAVGLLVKFYGDFHQWPSWISGLAGWIAGGSTAGAELVAPGVAATFQAFGIVMAMGISFFGWLILTFWFLLSNVKVFGPKKALKLLIGWMASEIPFINFLPTFTPTVWLIVRQARKEDREALADWRKSNAKVEAAARLPREIPVAEPLPA